MASLQVEATERDAQIDQLRQQLSEGIREAQEECLAKAEEDRREAIAPFQEEVASLRWQVTPMPFFKFSLQGISMAFHVHEARWGCPLAHLLGVVPPRGRRCKRPYWTPGLETFTLPGWNSSQESSLSSFPVLDEDSGQFESTLHGLTCVKFDSRAPLLVRTDRQLQVLNRRAVMT